MDSIFGIGAPELIVILILAGIVMGPNRIAVVARWLGKTTAQLQRISRDFMRQLNTELAETDETGELRSAMSEVQDLRRQLQDLRKEITSATLKPIEEGKTAVNDSKRALTEALEPPANNNNSIAPPGLSQLSNLPTLREVPDDPE